MITAGAVPAQLPAYTGLSQVTWSFGSAPGNVCPVTDEGLGDGGTAQETMSIEAGPQGGYSMRAWPPVCEERGLICRDGRDGFWRCT